MIHVLHIPTPTQNHVRIAFTCICGLLKDCLTHILDLELSGMNKTLLSVWYYMGMNWPLCILVMSESKTVYLYTVFEYIYIRSLSEW